ncbi:DUF2971 domain-containing protein [Cellvibrio mixtus]|uniref:DUF2971 domain-containing protein n=1 Tax=Cellvibrio mixtus TaxID=39650 RepID=UPI001F4402A5|nr:DUF2971 domain-containing protein [Cellvibrio mixtus]
MITCLKGYIFFSSPLSFNDPFELAVPIEKPSQKEIIEFFDSKTQKYIQKNTSIKRKLTNNIQNIWHREQNILATDDWLKTIGILCTTEDPKNLLMWAHYGSNHTGVCLGFDKNETLLFDAKPVHYSFDRPTLAFSTHKEISDQDIKNIFFNKSKEWEYEKEWRCIRRQIKETEKKFYMDLLKKYPEKLNEISETLASNGGPGIYDIENDSIKRIYFGCRIKNEYKERIINEIKSLNLQPKIFSLSLDKRHFDLEQSKIIL